MDDKGRLKLPVVFQEFVNSLPDDRKLFISSLDGETVVIYPVGIWRKNLKRPPKDPAGASAVAFVANDLGTEEKMDSQGRVTLNSELRADLGLGDKSLLHMQGRKEHIELITDTVYQLKRAEARRKAAAAAEQLLAEDWD